jgi:hypothetical protein
MFNGMAEYLFHSDSSRACISLVTVALPAPDLHLRALVSSAADRRTVGSPRKLRVFLKPQMKHMMLYVLLLCSLKIRFVDCLKFICVNVTNLRNLDVSAKGPSRMP